MSASFLCVFRVVVASAILSFASFAAAQTPPSAPDIPAKYTPPDINADYVKRVVMMPMRDGVKLYTVIVVPKGAKEAPILLTRTPYNAAQRATRNESPRMLATLPQGDEVFTGDGYIRVFQDVRGKYGSEGEYVMTRPLRGPLNPTAVDHSTDAYDTIDWLVKNVPESNGKVGMLGSSYEGFTVVMALVNPHPALKVAAPEEPDGGRLDGRRLVSLRRLPPAELRLHLRADDGPRRRQRRSCARVTTTTTISAAPDPPATSPSRTDSRVSLLAEDGRASRRTTRSGRSRRSTTSWASSRSRCRRCGFRDCGIRRTCGAPSTAT